MSSSAPTSFDELDSSPRFTISRAGHNCVRRFIGKWADLPAFITNLALDGPGGIPTECPALLTHSYIANITAEPYSPDNPPDSKAMPNPVIVINSYEGSGTEKQCLVTVTYELDQYEREWPSSVGKPSCPAHQALRLSIRTSGQFLTLPGRGAKWSGPTLDSASGQQTSSGTTTSSGPGGSGGTSDKHAAPDIGTRILICVQDIKVEQYYVRSSVNTAVWDVLIGKSNDGVFLGGTSGTVIYEGYEDDEDNTLNIDDPFCLKFTHNFRRRILRVGSSWVTWNHDYRDSVLGGDGGWTLVTLTSGALRYPHASFSSMFTDAGG